MLFVRGYTLKRTIVQEGKQGSRETDKTQPPSGVNGDASSVRNDIEKQSIDGDIDEQDIEK